MKMKNALSDIKKYLSRKDVCKYLRVFMLLCIIAVVLMPSLSLPATAQEDAPIIYASRHNPLYPQTHTPAKRLPETLQEIPVCRDSLQEAALDLRKGLIDWQQTITVQFWAPAYEEGMADALFDSAIAHTGDPKGGDYLLWHYKSWYAPVSYQSLGGKCRITVTYQMEYLTTAAQEKEMDIAVQALLDQLNVYNASPYDKVTAIYDYMCSNITYNYDDDMLNHTAYAALINHSSVCQGYVTLFYRLALSLGVDCRVVSGIGNGGPHGWNIVKLNGKYYNLDATWDAPRKRVELPYDYYLRCDANFLDHARDAAYLTPEFLQTYLMDTVDYTVQPELFVGDLNGDAAVTEDDAIYLLQYVLMPDLFVLPQEAEYTHDDKVSQDDVIYLLQHVLMPNIFPL